jgi:hypothetical protein
MPSSVKQQLDPMAHRKPASKTKSPSRTPTAARGLPPAVLRRIKINPQTLPALSDVDDDDLIDLFFSVVTKSDICLLLIFYMSSCFSFFVRSVLLTVDLLDCLISITHSHFLAMNICFSLSVYRPLRR